MKEIWFKKASFNVFEDPVKYNNNEVFSLNPETGNFSNFLMWSSLCSQFQEVSSDYEKLRFEVNLQLALFSNHLRNIFFFSQSRSFLVF